MKPILIVDDEAPIRALIRLTLERAGYTCDEAATGTEAADKIEANTYDLALLDIMLPGPDGYELLDYLRSVQTPVIFIHNIAESRINGNISNGKHSYIITVVKLFNNFIG